MSNHLSITQALRRLLAEAQKPTKPGSLDCHDHHCVRSVRLSPEWFGALRLEAKALGCNPQPHESYPDWMPLSFSCPPYQFDGVWVVADPGLVTYHYVLEREGLLPMHETDDAGTVPR